MDLQLSWLERTIHIRKVTGSSPVRSTKIKKSREGIFLQEKKIPPIDRRYYRFFLTLITVIIQRQRKLEVLIQD